MDVLRIEDEWASAEVRYASTDPRDLTARLREHLFLPARLLKVSFTPKEAEAADELLIPRHWTVRKQSASHQTAA